MTQLQTILYNSINWTEGLTVVAGIFFYKKLKNTYWKWFVIYLIFISLSDIAGDFSFKNLPFLKKYYYDFLIIPTEFLFLFWLYAKKSLKNQKLFTISCLVYLTFFILHFFNLDQIRSISSMSYTVGVFLLSIMIYLEFIKQIKSDDILNFQNNKMFYINIGVLLFYVGTLPFFTFDKELYFNNNKLWYNYKTFFLFSVNFMYLLFTASFIWGKPKP